MLGNKHAFSACFVCEVMHLMSTIITEIVYGVVCSDNKERQLPTI